MSKVAPKISKPGSIKMPTGTRNTEVGKHGSGIAPKPKGGAAIKGNDRPSMPAQAGLARVANVGNGQALGRLPIQNPPANQVGNRIGQPNPQTAAAATSKPKRKGLGAAFYGEY